MASFFISLYRFFEKKKWLMWVLLLGSAEVFVFFGLQVTYEEDMSKLLPQTEAAKNSGIVFGNLKVKDKIFMQFISKNGKTSQEDMTVICDEFMERLFEKDSSTNYLANALYKLDDDLLVNALDYALEYLPTFVDENSYPAFDSLLTPQAIDERMAKNAEMIMDDESGTVTSMVTQDPAGLRYALLGDGKQLLNDLGNYAMINNHFFCPDSSVEIAFLSPNIKAFDSKSCNKMVSVIEENIGYFEQQNPDLDIIMHGATLQSISNSRQVKRDLIFTIGISLIIIILVICLCFRNKSTIPFLLLPVVYGTFFALACMFWIKGTMSLMAIGIGAVVLGVALSYCLHVLTHYKYVDDPETVIREQAKPVCLGCLTTIGAFAGLLFTESELLSDFGIFASLALIGTTLSALIFMPHFFAGRKNTRNDRAFSFLNRINDYPLYQKYWLLGLIVVISAVCFFTSRNIRFDSNLQNIGYTAPSVEKSKTLYAEKNDPGFISQYYAVHAPNFDEALDNNKTLNRLLDSLKNEGIIRKYSKITSLFLSEEEQEKRIENWEEYWTESRIDAARKAITASARKYKLDPTIFQPFFDMLETEYESGSLLDAEVFPEELLCNYMEFAEDSSVILLTSTTMLPENKSSVNGQIARLHNAVVIDPFFYTSDMVKIINNDFNIVLLISSIFVLLVLLLSLRSLVSSLIAFLPMFLSWYIVQGIMAIFGIEFNLVNIIISSFIFGIGVDYSIFIMDGLLAKERGQSQQLLTYHKAAILFSAFTLIVVVCSLLFAQHPAIKSVGISTIIGMTATVLISYSLQPALFYWACRSSKLRREMKIS